MKSSIVSIVVPAYNEEANVGPFYDTIRDLFAGELEGCRLELIFVDDGSQDGTLARIKELAVADDRVKALGLSRNFGHQAALTAGLRVAGGEAIISMDCDLQDPPGIIPEMVARWRDGNKVVYARRKLRVDTPFKKITANWYYRILARSSDVDIPRNVGDFRLLDRAVLNSLVQFDEHARYLRGMVAWLGFKHDFVDFDRPDRMHGETHYTLRKMVKLAMDGLLNFTFFPLRLGLWIGMLSMLISVLFLAYMLFDIIVNDQTYQLFKWLTVLVFGFLGAQFTFLWVLGECIGRIYYDVRRRPLYVVNEKINLDP